MQPRRHFRAFHLVVLALAGTASQASFCQCNEWAGGYCEDDSTCAEYNTDPNSDGYGRGLTVCVDEVCRECRANQACALGEECRNNMCVQVPLFCRVEGECDGAGHVCRFNRWTAGCSDACPCGAAATCNAMTGICEGTGFVPHCVLDTDCTDSRVCVDASCVECRDETQCYREDSVDICMGSRCQPLSDCAVPGQCDGRGHVCAPQTFHDGRIYYQWRWQCSLCPCGPGTTCSEELGSCQSPSPAPVRWPETDDGSRQRQGPPYPGFP